LSNDNFIDNPERNRRALLSLLEDQKEAEKKLRESEKLFRNLADSTSVSILVIQDKKIVYVNKSSEELTGYQNSELLQFEFSNIICEEHQSILNQQTFERIKESNSNNKFEIKIKNKNGTSVWIDISVGTITWLGKDAFILSAIDISEIKTFEANLMRSEERYGLVIEAVNQGLWDWDVENNTVYFSPLWKKQIGYLDNELENKFETWVEHLHPEDKERSLKAVDEYLKNPEGYFELEFRFKHKDGSYRFIYSKAASVIDDNGKVTRLFGAHTDITKKKEQEQEVYVRQQTLRIYQNILVESATSNFIIEGKVEELSQEIDEKISKRIDIERVSIWLLKENESVLECVDLYEKSKNLHSSGYRILENEYQNEFDALKTSKFVDASFPYKDSRTKGYIETYLTPNNITSMLDCVINYSGKNFGTLCLEHVNTEHIWTQEEIDFGCQIADQVAICLSNRDKKIAEESLKKSEEKYRLIAENTADSIAIFDLNLNYTYVSPSSSNFLGYTPEEIIQKGLKNIVSPESYDAIIKTFQYELELEKSGKGDRDRNLLMVTKQIKKDGTIIDVEGVMSAIRDNNGKMTNILAVSRDITERLNAEQELKLKDKLLDAKNKIGEILLLNQDVDAAINASLEFICTITGQDRCYVFEYHYDEKLNQDVVSQRYEYVKDGILPQMDTNARQNIPISKTAPRWFEAFLKKEIIEGNIDNLPEGEYGILSEQNIVSLIEVPIFIYGNLWGFIGLDNCHEEYIWTEFERDLLKTSGILFGMTALRKKAEDKVKSDEEKMRLLVEGTSYFFFYTHDANGMVTYVSPSVEKITGHSTNDWLNQNHWFTTDSEINLTAQERTRRLLKGITDKKPFDLEILNNKNEKIILELYEAPIYDGKKVIGIQGIAHDVTERNRLNESIRILSRAIQQSPFSVVVTDLEGKVKLINPRFSEITGFLIEEIENKKTNFLRSGYHSNEFYKELWDTILSGKVWQGEIYNKKKDGSFYWENTIISPITNEDGRVTNFVGIKEDITSKKLMADKLVESEKELKEIWESSIDAMRLIDENGIVLNINNAYSKLFGISKEELIGHEFNISYQILEENKSLDHFRDKFTNKLIQPKFETKIMLHSNKEIWVELTNSYIELETGKSMLLSIFRDITERKNLISDLISAREKAEASDRLKSDFLAQISHEIRSPLNVITSYNSLLKNELDFLSKEEREDIFNGITNSSKRIIRTVDLILNSSEMQLGTYNPIFKPIDIHKKIAERAYQEFKRYANSHGLELKLNSNVKNSEIVCDEYSVYQSFVNLVDNAIKYTKAGSIEIKLTRNSKKSLQLEVIDTGIGISEEYQKHLFEPFSQEETGYTRKFEGTGLGLSLVKKYCDMNNIEIKVKSKKDIGTTFSMIFKGKK